MNDDDTNEKSNNYTTFLAQQPYESINTSLYYSYDSLKQYELYVPPKPNWRFYLGDSLDVYFQFYIKNAPNRFQRWMFKKVLGVRWEKIGDTK